MVNHFLLTLTEEQEDRVLTGRLSPGEWSRQDGSRCLMGAVNPTTNHLFTCGGWRGDYQLCIPVRYDNLCRRFGSPRVNNAIRARILANRLRRALRGTAGEVSVVQQ